MPFLSMLSRFNIFVIYYDFDDNSEDERIKVRRPDARPLSVQPHLTPLMVMEVSAMLVARMTLRKPSGGASNTCRQAAICRQVPAEAQRERQMDPVCMHKHRHRLPIVRM